LTSVVLSLPTSQTQSFTHSFNPSPSQNRPFITNQSTNYQTPTAKMRYTLIAAALIGAVVAMPAAPASYGETPAAYNAPDSENVYGTQVSNVQATTAAAVASSTCTDEAENIVPYTTPVAQSQVVESSVASSGMPSKSEGEGLVPAKQTDVASSTEVSPEMPAETPSGYASKPAMSAASSSESSPEMPAETPAGYATKPADVASSTEMSPQSPKESMPVESAPAGPVASSAVPKSPESSTPATEGETDSSPQMPAQYGSAIVPGSAPTAVPYPMGGNEASPVSPAQGHAAASGTVGVAMPTGTGSVSGTQQFEGSASSITAAGLFVSFGAIAALFM
jgi:hypothetical protein